MNTRPAKERLTDFLKKYGNYFPTEITFKLDPCNDACSKKYVAKLTLGDEVYTLWDDNSHYLEELMYDYVYIKLKRIARMNRYIPLTTDLLPGEPIDLMGRIQFHLDAIKFPREEFESCGCCEDAVEPAHQIMEHVDQIVILFEQLKNK